ncbi:MAG: hypothetical protein WBO71_00355 [Thermoanaerobaculia bacterium]
MSPVNLRLSSQDPRTSRPQDLSTSLLHCLLGLLVTLLLPCPARPDAIIITKAMTASTIAEVFIEEGRILVEVEIGGRDLEGFRNLMPDAVYQRMGNDPVPWQERLSGFFRQDLVIRADGGPPLSGRLVAIEPRERVARDEITGDPLPVPEGEGEPVVFAVLEYPLSTRPRVLSISPPTGEGGVSQASIGFMTYHHEIPVNDFRYLSTEEVLDLDWSDPWYSAFRNRNLRRQYDAPMNAFLYVEPYEVRTEIIARPLDLQRWVDLGLEGLETIPVEMQYELNQKVAAFLAEHQSLSIDGQPVRPELDRVNFLRRTLRTSSVIDPPEELDIYSATLGVIFVHPTEGLPQEASLTWDLFDERIQRVPGAATDEAGPLRFFLVPDDNILWWKNFLKNPTIPTLVELAPPPSLGFRILGWSSWLILVLFLGTIVMMVRSFVRERTVPRRAIAVSVVLLLAAGAAFAVTLPSRMTDEKAEEMVAGLLHNIYRAFDFRGEEAIYDVLDRSVSGDLLTEIYLETRRGLELASQGGARAKVKDIELLEVESRPLEGRKGFGARTRWNVAGSVGHWGHVHTRTNQYEADLTIEPVDGAWKLTNLTILQEERL